MTLKGKMWDRILGTQDGEPPQQIKELIAEAWEEGYGAGYEHGRKGAGPSAPKPLNPYKETPK